MAPNEYGSIQFIYNREEQTDMDRPLQNLEYKQSQKIKENIFVSFHVKTLIKNRHKYGLLCFEIFSELSE